MGKITKSAYGKTCIRCGADDGTIMARHYNGIRQHLYGKGRGIKCHDLASAEFCYECDRMFTEGQVIGFDSLEDRSEEFLHFIMLTNIRRYRDGVIGAV